MWTSCWICFITLQRSIAWRSYKHQTGWDVFLWWSAAHFSNSYNIFSGRWDSLIVIEVYLFNIYSSWLINRRTFTSKLFLWSWSRMESLVVKFLYHTWWCRKLQFSQFPFTMTMVMHLSAIVFLQGSSQMYGNSQFCDVLVWKMLPVLRSTFTSQTAIWSSHLGQGHIIPIPLF